MLHSNKNPKKNTYKNKRGQQPLAGIAVALALLLTLVAGLDGIVHAQGTATPTGTPTATRTRNVTATSTATATETATATSTRRAGATRPAATVTPTITQTPTATLTATSTTGADAPVVPVTVTVVITVTSVATTPVDAPTATPTPTTAAGPPVVELLDTEVLTGTILANRTEVTTTFFLEGRLYELPPLRSTSAVLQRPLTVLTLYNCEADDAANEECFWDPYPVRQDGFYEIVNGAEIDAPLSLILQEAAPPPDNQIWIQNRTGHSERFLYGGNLYELANSNVLELTLDEVDGESEVPLGEIYLRRCLGLDDRAVCEWLPAQVVGGIYYALIDETTPGILPNSAVTNIRLDLVLGEERLAALATPTPEPTPIPAPTEPPPTPEPALAAAEGAVVCQAQVPRLNVRGGPGVEYLVVAQIAQAEDEGRFAAVGRNAAGDWLAVDPATADGGWVINTPQFVICEADTEPLAVTQVTDGRLAQPTPTPAPVAAGEDAGEENTADGEADAETGDAAGDEASAGEQAIAPGQALLIATNAFDQDIRFTLSASQHGLPEGSPSEYDLAPGQSISFLIRAGRVQFSVSSPFRSSSGNAEFFLDEGFARELFLRFNPSPSNSDQWELAWE